MRKAFLLVFALVACAKNDAANTDSAAGTVAASETHTPLTASDVTGTWTGMTMAEGSDSVVNRWTSMRESDTAGKLVSDNATDTISYTVVYDADSMVITSKPFVTKADAKTQVVFRSVGRLKDGKLFGTSTTTLAAKPDSVVARGRWEATKKP